MNAYEIFVSINADTDGLNTGLAEAKSKASNFGSTFLGTFGGTLLSKAVSGAVSGIASIGRKFIDIGKQALESYADYEQLTGGIETLFKGASEKVMSYAKEAYKTAGMSANEYMELTTSFSASLINSLGGDTEKAADLSNRAITDMSDNVNKMGNDVALVQNAYNGFAKGNFTMLDNLKLGYGGTKEEMQRLLDKATEISGVKYDISSFADIVEAIHVVQEEMGITGTTAEEAEKTISGSLGMVKASWKDMLTAVGTGEDVNEATDNFISALETFVDNVGPVLERMIPAFGQVLEKLSPLIDEYLPKIFERVAPLIGTLVKTLGPPFFKAIGSLIGELFKFIGGKLAELAKWIWGKITGFFSDLGSDFATAAQNVWDAITGVFGKLVGFFGGIVDGIKGFFVGIGEWFAEKFQAAVDLVKGIWEGITGFFSGIWEGIKGVFSGVGGWFKEKFENAKNNASNAWSNVKGRFSTAWANIKGAFANVGGWFSTKFSGARELALKAWSNAKSRWTTVYNNVTGAFKSIGGWFSTKFRQGKELAVNAWSNVKSRFSTIAEKVKKAFTEIDWKSVGSRIIEGIKKGMEWAQGLVNAAKSAAKKALNAAKDTLGIKSPSRVFRDEVGKQITAGWALGIDDGSRNVMSAMDSLNDLVTTEPANIGNASGGAVSTNSYSIPMTFNISGAESPEAFADRVARELQMRLRTA